MQPDLPWSGWYVPGEHRVAAAAPDLGTAEPSGAGEHVNAPAAGAKKPGEHGVGALAPLVGANVPTGVMLHSRLP